MTVPFLDGFLCFGTSFGAMENEKECFEVKKNHGEERLRHRGLQRMEVERV